MDRIRVQVTSRDVSILRDVWRYRYLNTQQISRLYFQGHVKLAQRRLRALTSLGVVDRFRPETIAGFQAWWYRLARPGARVVAADQDETVEAILPPPRRPRTMGFLAHHALVTDVRIWLREGCSQSREFRYRFAPSYEEDRAGGRRQRHIALAVPGHRRLLIPDAAFVLERSDGKQALFLLEADRGTEPLTGSHPSAIERKLVMYRAAFDSRAETRYAHLFDAAFNGFRILCIVPDKNRQRGFLELAAKLDLVPLVWVTTAPVLGTPGDLDVECWAVTPDDPLHRLTE